MTAWFKRWRTLLAPHQSFLQLLSVFVVFRLLAAPFLQPGGFLTAATPDQFFYYHLAGINSGGQSPFVDYWTEFPPIFPWIVVLATRLSLLVPAWSNGIFWFNAILRWLMLVFEAGSLILLYASANKLWNQAQALSSAQAFALLFVPLWVFLGWFDNVVLFFLMLALYGLVRHHAVVSGLGIGLGFGAKLFPLAVLPAAVRVFRRRQLIIMLGTIAAGLLVVFGPFLLVSPDHTTAFFSTLQGRASWETIWALLDGYDGWGVVSSLALRNDPLTAGQLVPGTTPSRLPWLLITGLFGIVGSFAWTRSIDWQDPKRSVAFSGLTFGMMLLYAKGYSPQWALYLTALSLLILGGWRGVMYAIALDILTVLEWPVAFVMFEGAPGFLRAVIIMRTIMTVVLCVEFAVVVYSGANWTEQVGWWLPRAAGVGFAGALVIGLFPAAQTYQTLRRDAEPTAIILNRWENDPASTQLVLTTQPIIMQRLAAFMPKSVSFRQMPNGLGTAWVEAGNWLAEVESVEQSDYRWLIEERSQMEYWDIGDDLLDALSDEHCWVSVEWYETTRATAFAGTAPAILESVDVDFEGRVSFEGYGFNHADLPHFGMQCIGLELITADLADSALDIEVNVTTLNGGRVTGKRFNLMELLEGMGKTSSLDEVTISLAYLGDQTLGEYRLEVGIYDTVNARWLNADGYEDSGPVTLGLIEIE